MLIEPLGINDAWVLSPTLHADSRGTFLEWMRQDVLEARVGHPLHLAQANCSTSGTGVVRGVHYADVPPGQAKYVTCVSGTILDVVVDLRIGSPTYGRHEAVRLDDAHRRAVYIGEGLGHAFMALSDATVVYLCSTAYDPEREHGVHPFDAALAIDWPLVDAAGNPMTPRLSDKDAAQPSLAAAAAADALPTFGHVEQFSAGQAR